MFSFRRAALRLLSSPSSSLIAKPRSITTVAPSALRINRTTSSSLLFQRRWASDEVPKSVDQEESQSVASAINSAAESVSTASDSAASLTDSATEASEYASENSGRPALDDGLRVTEHVGGNRYSRRGTASGSKHDDVTPKRTIYIGNLFFDVTAEELKAVMEQFGTVVSARLIYDTRGLSKGFGYVGFETVESAAKAIEAMHLTIFEGRRLVVQYSANESKNNDSNSPPSNTLFIGNMSYEMTDRDLNALFRNIKNVVDVRVAVDRRTGQPRGFAHAEFTDTDSATEAFKVLKNKESYGRKLRVDYSANSSPRNRYGQRQSGEAGVTEAEEAIRQETEAEERN